MASKQLHLVLNSNNTASSPGSKPIKLRNACNLCFAAKVRCDGDKAGCRRCVEKSLPCQYSVSRVGKVVGKRKKRPVDDSVGMVNSEAWKMNSYVPAQSLLSPATTPASDQQIQTSCTSFNWASLIALDGLSPESLGTPDPHYQSLDMPTCRGFSFTSDLPVLSQNGFPTPTLSPPQVQFLSPMILEAPTSSRQSSITPDDTALRPLTRPAHDGCTPEPCSSEDNETVCIKLLGHLKKYSNDEQSLECMVSLIRKSNAAVRRILRSRYARENYACQLLISNIMIHIVTLCEKACRRQCEGSRAEDSHYVQRQVGPYSSSEYLHASFFDEEYSARRYLEALRAGVLDVIEVSSAMGDRLKRRPLSGFQTMGRHESLHLALEQRLRSSLAGLMRT